MEEKNYLELNLPIYVQESLDRVKMGKVDSMFDCYLDDLYGSINSSFWDNEITEEQADYLRYTYLFRKEEE